MNKLEEVKRDFLIHIGQHTEANPGGAVCAECVRYLDIIGRTSLALALNAVLAKSASSFSQTITEQFFEFFKEGVNQVVASHGEEIRVKSLAVVNDALLDLFPKENGGAPDGR